MIDVNILFYNPYSERYSRIVRWDKLVSLNSLIEADVYKTSDIVMFRIFLFLRDQCFKFGFTFGVCGYRIGVSFFKSFLKWL